MRVALPATFSPDLNPIEEASSKIKGIPFAESRPAREMPCSKLWGSCDLIGHRGGRAVLLRTLRLRHTGSIIYDRRCSLDEEVGGSKPLALATGSEPPRITLFLAPPRCYIRRFTSRPLPPPP